LQKQQQQQQQVVRVTVPFQCAAPAMVDVSSSGY